MLTSLPAHVDLLILSHVMLTSFPFSRPCWPPIHLSRPCWSHFQVILTSFPGHVDLLSITCWYPFQAMLTSLPGNVDLLFRSCWPPFQAMLTSFPGHVDLLSITCWSPFLAMLTSLSAYMLTSLTWMCRWRSSLWKLIWKELLAYNIAFIVIAVIYRYTYKL